MSNQGFAFSDALTKNSASADELQKAVETGILPRCDSHPPFRTWLEGKHKAFWIDWIGKNIGNAHEVTAFLSIDVNFHNPIFAS